MPTTTRRANRYPAGTDAADVPLWMQRLAEDLDDAPKDSQGVLASRPAAGVFGRRYYATDENVEYRDDGSAWRPVGSRIPSTSSYQIGDQLLSRVDAISPGIAVGLQASGDLGAAAYAYGYRGQTQQVRIGEVGGKPGIIFGYPYGSGDGALWKDAADQLHTDDNFRATLQLRARHGGAAETEIGDIGGKAGIRMGADTSFVRDAANVIGTDDSLAARGDLNVGKSTDSFHGVGIAAGDSVNLDMASYNAAVDRKRSRIVNNAGFTSLQAVNDAYSAVLWTMIQLSHVSGVAEFPQRPTSGGIQLALTSDSRFSDQRVPTDGSVTDAKVAGGAAIAESKLNLASDAAAGTPSRRSLGGGANQAAAGNDSRLSDQRVPVDGSVSIAKLAAAVAERMFSPGDIKLAAKGNIDSGWLRCDGSLVSRTTYANLFSVIGILYGNGDGSTTFQLPDLRGRIPVGLAPSAEGGHADVDTLGKSDGFALAGGDRRPKHTHTTPGTGGNVGGALTVNSGTQFQVTQVGHTHSSGGSTGEAGPDYQVVNYMIKT